MKIGIYGGAFDPPHSGHINGAENAIKFLSLDRLFILPAYVSPLKNESETSATDRLNMCLISFTNEKETVSDFEIKSGGISYTKDTVKHFRNLFPHDELYLIIGTDQAQHFFKWKEPEYILSEATVAVMPRYGEKIPEISIKNHILIDMPVTEISSTEIRKNILENNKFIPEKVRDYIKNHGLYIQNR